jgi:DNA-binding CsgD family transcriptional regulator
MTAVIEVTGLTKRYAGQAVVDGISFHVEQGEIFGILGPNGAGKTTAVECMEGLRRRDGGEVRVLGLDPRTDGRRLHQRIGVQLQQPLSQRELDILGLIALGCANREAAARLFISEATVKTHLLHIYAKLGVNDRAAAVATGFQRGLLPRPLKPARDTHHGSFGINRLFLCTGTGGSRHLR